MSKKLQKNPNNYLVSRYNELINEEKSLGLNIKDNQPKIGDICNHTNLPIIGKSYLHHIDHLLAIKKIELYTRSYILKNNYGENVFYVIDSKLNRLN